MAKKHKNISWTLIIITAMILIFLLFIIFGFNSNDYFYENSKTTKTSDNLFDNNLNNQVQEISINGINQERVLNYPNQEISTPMEMHPEKEENVYR